MKTIDYKRFIVLAILGLFIGLWLGGCNGGTSEWTVYDAEYVGAQSNIPGLQGNHNGWEDPQPDHGQDGEHHGPNWRKWWKKWCEENGKPVPDDGDYFNLPAYFMLRHAGMETLFVNADDLMSIRPELSEESTLVALHYMDHQNPNLRFYPDFLFDIFGNFVVENYEDWIADD